jgi:carboxyl-terminal processing protease
MPRQTYYAFAMVGMVGFCCYHVTEGAKPKDEMLELYGLFVDAVEKVQSHYVRPVTRRELLESAIEGMLQNLDPHSSFFNTTQQRVLRRQIEGRLEGIGVQVDIDPETARLRVIAPMPGTPAYDAGILAGDQITEIDGQSAEGMSPDKAAEVLRGRPGTEVKLTVVHEGSDEPATLTMNRAIIELPSVLGDRRKPDDRWDFMLDKDKKIGYLRITTFMQNTAEELKAALDQLKEEGATGLIIDLRDNPGGMLSSVVEICDLFLPGGEIVSTKGRNTLPKRYEARKDAPYEDLPLVVLINQYSASASEIFAAAMQDHKRAAVVGQRSYGKGSVQNLIELEGGNSVLKLTVASYYRPSGENIHRFPNSKPTDKWGVSPDAGMEVKLVNRDFRRWFDSRRERDRETMAKGQRRPAAAKAEATKSNGAPAPDAKKDQPKAKTNGTRRAFVDPQLDKALEVIRARIAAADPKAKAA